MIPIDRYLSTKSLEINKQIKGLKLIYLDVNYWLKLRDELIAGKENQGGMLNMMLDLVVSGKCLFPVSDITYYEVLKQQDEQTRRTTLDAIAMLSDGICLLDDHKRVKIEFLHWIAESQKKAVYAANELVWSKLPILIGYKGYASIDYGEGTHDMQNAFFDFMAKMPLTEITPDALLRQYPFTFKDNVDEFNANKKLYKHQNKTYEELFLSELSGMLDEADNLFSAAMQEQFIQDTGKIPSPDEINANVTQQFRTLIYHCFKLKKIGTHLPFFRICADIYSSFRWNTERLYKDGNDTLDVMHAAAALPYCDYFFTERELHAIISQRKLDQLYSCKVASKITEVIELLRSI